VYKYSSRTETASFVATTKLLTEISTCTKGAELHHRNTQSLSFIILMLFQCGRDNKT
jgi:hypothetical protein